MTHVLAGVACPYANGPRHIGHVSGFGVPSDVFGRYMRMAGNDVLMVSGTDPLRYFISVAGPETQDTDFTWSEFVRRNNDELVSTWGNLVNRTASLIATNLGAIPAVGPLLEPDVQVLKTSADAFATVGDLIRRHRLRQAIGEAMRVAMEANQYLSQQAPWRLKEIDPDRMRTILHTAAQVVADSNRLFAPFLPHAAERVHAVLGGTGSFLPEPVVQEADDLDGGPAYPIITGDYDRQPAWRSEPIIPGTPISRPAPVFAKLNPGVVEEELSRLQAG